MKIALANLSGSLLSISFVLAAVWLYHEDAHKGWAIFWDAWLILAAACCQTTYTDRVARKIE